MDSTSTWGVGAVPAREPAWSRSGVPVLEPSPDGLAQRFAAAIGRGRHPALVFLAAIAGGALILGLCSIAGGYLLVDVVGQVPAIRTANIHVDTWLAAHRTPGRTEASLIGSIAAGGVVLPIIAGAAAAGSAVIRKWRLAGYALFSLLVESGAYRFTTLFFHEHRPRVHRLESLPVNASYPSGHTAASIAVYGGAILLLTSRFRSPLVRTVSWAIAVAIPVYVAFSRMYRGMHHPLDTIGGALLGIAALGVVVFACRAAGAAAAHRKAR